MSWHLTIDASKRDIVSQQHMYFLAFVVMIIMPEVMLTVAYSEALYYLNIIIH